MEDNQSGAPAEVPSANDQSQESTQGEAASAEQQIQEKKEEIRRYKLKIDGVEEEVDEPEVIRRAQMSSAAQKRIQNAAQAMKRERQLIEKLKSNPFEIFNDPSLGHDPKALREKLEEFYRRQYIDPEMLTPEQRELAQLRREREQEAELRRQEQEEHQSRQMQQLEEHYRGQYTQVIITGLQSEGLPKNEFTVKRMAKLMQDNARLGLSLPPEQLAKLVREDYIKEQRALFSSTDEDTLLKLLGDDVALKLRKADLKRLKSGAPQLPNSSQRGPATVSQAPKKKTMSETEWEALKKQRRNGG